jgi:hypothetical protein
MKIESYGSPLLRSYGSRDDGHEYDYKNLSLMISSKDNLLMKCKDTLEDLNKVIDSEKDSKEKINDEYLNMQKGLQSQLDTLLQQLKEKNYRIEIQV